jgi:hypothetical protein
MTRKYIIYYKKIPIIESYYTNKELFSFIKDVNNFYYVYNTELYKQYVYSFKEEDIEILNEIMNGYATLYLKSEYYDFFAKEILFNDNEIEIVSV